MTIEKNEEENETLTGMCSTDLTLSQSKSGTP